MVLVGFGISFSLPGETLSVDGYHVLADIGLTDFYLAMFMTILGVLRLVALYINGSWKRTPTIRMYGAIVGAAVFMSFAVGFFLPIVTKTMPPNTAWGTYLILALWDIYASYKAGNDVRATRK